jgi:hypothetical protein
MSKKLEGNGLWESSRMMLPQHKEAIIEDYLTHEQQACPMLDEQALEGIERALIRSFRERKKVTLHVFDHNKGMQVELEGIVTTIQTVKREIKLAVAIGEWKWVRMEQIIFAIIDDEANEA